MTEKETVEIDLSDILAFSLYTNWSQAGCRFGQLSLGVTTSHENGTMQMRVSGDTETMGREWVRKALHALADTVANALPEEGLTGIIEIPVKRRRAKDTNHKEDRAMKA